MGFSLSCRIKASTIGIEECDDLFDGKDPRERIMVFQLPGYKIGDIQLTQ